MIDKILSGLERMQKIPTGFLLAVSIVLGLILFLPEGTAKTLAIDGFRQTYRTFLGPALLLFAAFRWK